MTVWSEFSLGAPWFLLLLLILPILAWLLGRRGKPSALRYSSTSLLATVARPPRFGPGRILAMLRWAIAGLLIFAAAQPRVQHSLDQQEKYGIDIALVCDVSPSMKEEDFYVDGKAITRLEALSRAVSQFTSARPNDRTGMVGFAGNVYLLSPLTLDAGWLSEILHDVMPRGGTAIGEGIFGGIELLKDSKEESRVMIVVSDGQNNAGRPPLEAAEYARRNNIRIHTLSIINTQALLTMQAEGDLMDEVADKTGGQHFIATDSAALVGIYRQIDMLEKNRIEQKHHRRYAQLFSWFVIPAVLLCLLEFGLANTILLRVP